MPRVISSKTFDSLKRAVAVFSVGSDVLRDEISGDELERDTERIRSHWPDVTARDLLVASVAMAFCLASLDGTVPQLSSGGYCTSLLKSEAENLKAHGLGGGAE